MKELVYFPNRKVNGIGNVYIRSDCEDDFFVVRPVSGTAYHLYHADEKIGEVDGCHIKVYGRALTKEKLGWFRWGWILPTSPPSTLVPQLNDCDYKVGNDVVVTIVDSLAYGSNIFSAYQEKSNKERSLTLRYDEKIIDHAIAYCLLMVELSRIDRTN
ncbi:hypothetical protein ACFXAP_001841 [Vibrio cholerae]